jgi:hypothetical protein
MRIGRSWCPTSITSWNGCRTSIAYPWCYADTVRQAKEQYDRAARERKQEENQEVASRKVDQRRRMLETMLARLQADYEMRRKDALRQYEAEHVEFEQAKKKLHDELEQLAASQGEALANRKRVADEANSALRPRMGPKSNEAEKSSPATDKLDRILEKLEQLERRLDRLERDRPQRP